MAEATYTAAVTIPAPRAARLLRATLEILLVALVAIVLFALVLGRIVPMTGRQTIIIGGGSMEPTIPLGSAAIAEPAAAASIDIGDVISVRAGNGAVVTHRVTRIVDREGGTWFELKGDANADPDPVLIDAATMLGKVTATIPYAGFLLRFFATPAAVVMVLGLGCTLILALYLLDDVAQPRRRRTSGGAAATGARADAAATASATANRPGADADAPVVTAAVPVAGPAGSHEAPGRATEARGRRRANPANLYDVTLDPYGRGRSHLRRPNRRRPYPGRRTAGA
jgi:signal peptidase